MDRSRNRQPGFSLIELVMTLAVLGIVIALGMPAFGTWIMNTRIRTTADSIANGLQVARNEAVRRNAAVQFAMAATGSSWTVSCVAVAPACPNTGPIQARATGEGSSDSITVTPNNGLTITFNGFGMMSAPVLAGNGVASFDIDGPDTAESRELRITIQAGGNVRMCDPQTTAPDPRAC